MNTDAIAVAMVMVMAVVVNLFVAIYAFRPWWRSLTGWGLMVEGVGMALLVDISLTYHWFGSNYPGRDLVRFSVYGFIIIGWSFLLAAMTTAGSRAEGGEVTPRHKGQPEGKVLVDHSPAESE